MERITRMFVVAYILAREFKHFWGRLQWEAIGEILKLEGLNVSTEEGQSAAIQYFCDEITKKSRELDTKEEGGIYAPSISQHGPYLEHKTLTGRLHWEIENEKNTLGTVFTVNRPTDTGSRSVLEVGVGGGHIQIYWNDPAARPRHVITLLMAVKAIAAAYGVPEETKVRIGTELLVSANERLEGAMQNEFYRLRHKGGQNYGFVTIEDVPIKTVTFSIGEDRPITYHAEALEDLMGLIGKRPNNRLLMETWEGLQKALFSNVEIRTK